MGGSLNGSAGRIIKTGAGTGRVLPPTESTLTTGGAGTGTGGRTGATDGITADGTTGEITTADKDGQKDIVSPRQRNLTGPHASKDTAEEAPKRAWAPQMQTHGETPHEMGVVDLDRG
jgi:hypothetical protein